MAITTLDGLVAGLQTPVQFYKVGGTQKAAGIPHSLFYATGNPGAATVPSPGIGGATLTSYPGQLSFPAAVGGKNIHAARLEAVQTSSMGSVSLVDRLWHNSGFNVTSTSAQAFTGFTGIPARDRDGTTNGEGVMFAMEVATALGAGVPTLTVSYTNSAGTSGRTGTIGPITATSTVGTFYPMSLQDTDTGVRSVQSVTSSATMTSGAVVFVLYREIVSMPLAAANFGIDRDAMALGLPRAYDQSVPFLVTLSTATTSTTLDGAVAWAQG